VLTLDLIAGSQTGGASLAWLHDTYAVLAPQIAEGETDTAEYSDALGRTGDPSLPKGMWQSRVAPEGWAVLAESLVAQARGDASWWAGWLSMMGPARRQPVQTRSARSTADVRLSTAPSVDPAAPPRSPP